MSASLRGRVFLTLPHSLRRAVFAIMRPRNFRALQAQRLIETETGHSLKPYDDHQCIFFHVPKAAGISVCRTLFGNLAGGHRTLSNLQLVFSKREFDRYFKFTFVRNPWDRALSAFRFLRRGGFNDTDRIWAEKHLSGFSDFADFVLHGLRDDEVLQWIHFRPQTDYLTIPGRNRLHLDFTGYFENLPSDFAYVVERLGLQGSVRLRHDNRSTPGSRIDYRDFYSNSMRRVVEEVYQKDIELLGYSFDNQGLADRLACRRSEPSLPIRHSD